MMWSRRWCCVAGVGFVALGGLLVASGSAATVSGARAAASVASTGGSSGASLTASQLAGYLRAAALIRKVPADLTPSLSDPEAWAPVIVENGCQLSLPSEIKSKPCVYGDPKAHTSVVLFGDSHAGSWFPALDQIARQRHWRLLIFTRAGCSPPEVLLNAGCDTWRQNTENQIAAIHPAIVFLSWARWIEVGAKPLAGVAKGYGNAWLNGVAAIFEFLHRSAGRVIFISDVPTLSFGGAECLSKHPAGVRRCNNTPRSKAMFLPKIRAKEFRLAAETHIASIDPIPWLCTATVCPVLVRNILVYWDTAHMTTAWSTFIAPVLNKSITSILARHR